MNKAYSRIDWENYPSGNTPINEDNLNKMDGGIDTIDDRVVEMDATKATKIEVSNSVVDIQFDEQTGIFTITRRNGSTFTINTLLEKIATNFRYDYDTQELILTLVDGTTQTIDLSALLTQYEFVSSGTIQVEVSADGKVSHRIINGSITDAMIEAGYLSKVTTQATKSETNAIKSQSYAVGGTNSRENEETDNAKHYYTKSKEMFDTLVGSGDIDTVTTTDTTLSNSKASIAKINDIWGKSEQDSYSGKNLYDEMTNNKSASTSGITLTKNEDGTLTISGDSTAATNMVMNEFALQAGTYYMTKGTTSGCTVALYDKTNKKFLLYGNGTFTLSAETTLDIRIQTTSGNTASGTIRIQIERGSEATPYESYVGGIASPNPEYPQDIKSVGDKGSLTITGHGKNLLPYPYHEGSKTENGLTFTVKEDGGVSVSGTPTSNTWIVLYNDKPLLKTGKCTFSCTGSFENLIGEVYIIDSDNKTLTTATYTTGTTINLDNYPTATRWRVNIKRRSNVATSGTAYVQIEEGGTATPYEPYVSKSITIPLSEPLRSGDDVEDEIVKKDGLYGILRNVKTYTFDGSENWGASNVQSFYIGYNAGGTEITKGMKYPSSDNDLASMKCTHFTIDSYNGVRNGTNLAISVGKSGSIGLRFNEKYITSSDMSALKAWLSENKPKIQYELAEPVFEPFAEEYQHLFYELESFDNVTYITTDSEVQPTIELEYAVTDNGALILNNYAKSNLAELKADKAVETADKALTKANNVSDDLNPSIRGSSGQKIEESWKIVSTDNFMNFLESEAPISVFTSKGVFVESKAKTYTSHGEYMGTSIEYFKYEMSGEVSFILDENTKVFHVPIKTQPYLTNASDVTMLGNGHFIDTMTPATVVITISESNSWLHIYPSAEIPSGSFGCDFKFNVYFVSK